MTIIASQGSLNTFGNTFGNIFSNTFGRTTLGILVLLPFCLSAHFARASDSSTEYKQALIRAQRKISRERQRGAQAITSSAISTLHRPYEIGDSWDVLSWNWSDLTPSAGRSAVFHYTVTQVVPGQVHITVTQRLDFPTPPVDLKVQSVQLTLQNLDYDSQREIHLQDRVVTLSGDTMPGSLSPIESYPFEFPDLRDAEKVTLSQTFIQEIPPDALIAAKRDGFQLDPTQATRFESQDSFGRPVNVVWQKGDLWPTYADTSHGFMFLLR